MCFVYFKQEYGTGDFPQTHLLTEPSFMRIHTDVFEMYLLRKSSL